MKTSTCLLVAMGLFGLSMAGPGLIVPDSGANKAPSASGSSVAAGRGIAFPATDPNQTTRFRAPAYKPAGGVETRQEYHLLNNVGHDRQLGSFLDSLGDMSFDLGMRMPVYKLHMKSIVNSVFGDSLPSLSGGTSNLFKLNMGTVAALGGLALVGTMFYPQIFSTLGLVPSGTSFRNNAGAVTVDDIADNVNKILGNFNIDPNACLNMAMCSVGRTTSESRAEGRSNSAINPLEILDTILNMVPVKNNFLSKTVRQAREFGSTGGDCEQYNKENKCPVSANSLKSLLKTLL